MDSNTPAKKTDSFKSESSIFVHPIQHPKENQLKLPTWGVMVILIIAFFILKPFIYISDKKRHGK
jgi:hypothetical protein